jgi:hypothetical protein
MAAVAVDVSRLVVRAFATDGWQPSARSLAGFQVFDVGQGYCIGLVGDDGTLVVYVDYGGLVDHPDRGNPGHTTRRLAVFNGEAPIPVILTHWDKDHWWSAQHKNPQARDVPWIVPRQWVGPATAVFASTLNRARCWPERLGTRPVRLAVGETSAIEIRKTAPYDVSNPAQDRNHSGLVIFLLIQDERRPWVGLLPGDCPFDWIPRRKAPIDAVVAYHHGSGNGATPATFDRWIAAETRVVFSFGRNPYGHPQQQNYARSRLQAMETPTCRTTGMTHHQVLAD